MGVGRMVEAAHAFMLGLVSFVQTPSHVVLVGLDSSGKTTVLLRLKYGQYVNTLPTVGFNCEKVRAGGAYWMVWDVGGAERVRPLWRPYTRGTDALIFVVDSSSDDERLEEARLELQRLAKQQASQCASLNRPRPPMLILANKQDLPSARDIHSLTKALGLNDLQECQSWTLAAACAVTGEGLDEAMEVLQQLVAKSKKVTKSKNR
ncbi:ADP-ribosylation factor-like protein 4C [Armadillidium nasatum]|uniref:ADP-ribosylation factor-like protein 4C n=1 Tax=Armadillidium nasatum TaxID=96803 RepID=A0A5N5SL73_9CRUS|nr:ADP-ribosylation factor-like protein 4C [Armadillidium nasatum]